MDSIQYIIKYNYVSALQNLIEKGTDLNDTDNEMNTMLHYASKYNNLEITILLLKNKANPNIVNLLSYTPLHVAVMNDNIEITKLLIQYKADLNIKDKDGCIPLHHAIRNLDMVKLLVKNKSELNCQNCFGYTPFHRSILSNSFDVAEYLLSKNVDVNTESFRHIKSPIDSLIANRTNMNKDIKRIFYQLIKKGSSPDLSDNILVNVVNNNNHELLEMLIKLGGNVNAADDKEDTLLLLAIRHDNFNMVKILIDNNADVNKLCGYGNLPIYAAMGSTIEIVKYIIENRKDVILKTYWDFHIIYYSAIYGKIEILEYLFDERKVNEQNEVGNTLLHLAIENKHIDIIEFLLKKGAYINIKNKYGSIPLSKILNSDQDIVKCVLNNINNKNFKNDGVDLNEYIVNNESHMLIEHFINKGNVNTRTKSNELLLNIAINKNDIDTVITLLQKGADVNAIDDKGNTALKYAIEKDDTNIINLLLEEDVNINKIDSDENSVLMLAIKKSNIELIEYCINNNHPLDIVNKDHYSALHYAIIYNRVDELNLLISKGVNKSIKDINGNTPLHHAVLSNDLEIVKCVVDDENINMQNNEKETALIMSILKGYDDITKFLLSNNTTVNLVDNKGNTCLHYILYNGDINVNIVKILIYRGIDINQKNNENKSSLDLANDRGFNLLECVPFVDTEETCKICFESFNKKGFEKKKVLYCFHTYCNTCADSLIKNGIKQCSVCRANIDGFVS